MSIIKDLWAALLAALILTWFFRDGFTAAKSEGKDRQYIHDVDIGARWAIGLLSILFIVLVSFLSWPPSKGDNAGHYEYIHPNSANQETSTRTIATEGENKANDENAVPSNQQQGKQSLNQFNKDKRDVNAQEGMWRATNAVVILAYIQAIIGLGTMIFLVMTFRTQRSELGQAKRSADAAGDMLSAQITKDSPFIMFFCESKANLPNKGVNRVQCFAQNIGQSAALNVAYSSISIWRDFNGFSVNGSTTHGPSTSPELIPSEKDRHRSIAPLYQKDRTLGELVESTEKRLYIILKFKYETVFGKCIKKRAIYRLDPISPDFISYKSQKKLINNASSGFSMSREQLLDAEIKASDIANIIRIDMYECSDWLLEEAMSVIREHSLSFGVDMPLIGEKDKDE